MCVCVYMRVGFQDENESNTCFMYEKYLILSERKRRDVQCRYAGKNEEKREKMIIHDDNSYY